MKIKILNYFGKHGKMRLYSIDEDNKGIPVKDICQEILNHHEIRIICGEGVLLVDPAFLKSLEILQQNGGKALFIISHKEFPEPKFGEKISITTEVFYRVLDANYKRLYHSTDQKKLDKIILDVKKLMKDGPLYLYLARGRPYLHFVVFDDNVIFLQEEHEHGEPKKHIRIDRKGFVQPYKERFDYWLKQCSLIETISE